MKSIHKNISTKVHGKMEKEMELDFKFFKIKHILGNGKKDGSTEKGFQILTLLIIGKKIKRLEY